MHDLIIVGGGAAALAAVAYALDKQLDLRLVAERLGGKSGWQRHASELQPAPQSAGEDVVHLLRERVAQRSELVLSDSVTAITKANGVFQIETKRHGVKKHRPSSLPPA